MDATGRYLGLAARVDDFFRRVEGRHAADLACRAGCSSCCLQLLTVTPVEAHVVTSGVATLDAATRARLAGRASAPRPDRCAALDDDGSCAIYAFRPLVCRSHGVPVRSGSGARGGLPVIQACHLNFTAGFDAVEADCVLDQETLSTVLAAVDAAYADDTGRARGTRVPLADCLR